MDTKDPKAERFKKAVEAADAGGHNTLAEFLS